MAKRTIDVASSAERVTAALQGELGFLCHYLAEDLAPLVESEIELSVLTTLVLIGRLTKMNFYVGEEPPANSRDIQIIPQYQWNNFRIDFCLNAYGQKSVFIECDGHDFHERTKEQAERDRSRDRAVQFAGIPILRFTGREIWRDVSQVTVEILNFLGSVRAASKNGKD